MTPETNPTQTPQATAQPVAEEEAPQRKTLKFEAGSREHFWLLMAPYHLQMVTGSDAEHLQSFARDVWASALATRTKAPTAPVAAESFGTPVEHLWFSQAALDVTSERRRQIDAEGWSPEHDDEHAPPKQFPYRIGALAAAAACYCQAVTDRCIKPISWPWACEWWKPKDRRSNLVRAGALILAEIERLDRAAAPHPEAKGGASHG